MSDKCVCHINGYAVKDATARKEIASMKEDITALKENAGGGVVYHHSLSIVCMATSDENNTVAHLYSSDPTPITNAEQLLSKIDGCRLIGYCYANGYEGTVIINGSTMSRMLRIIGIIGSAYSSANPFYNVSYQDTLEAFSVTDKVKEV